MKSTSALSAYLLIASASSCNAFAPVSRPALALLHQKTLPSTVLSLSDKPKEDVATEAVFAPPLESEEEEEEDEDVLDKVEMLGKGAAKVRNYTNNTLLNVTWQ
jgi:hypothetical protein